MVRSNRPSPVLPGYFELSSNRRDLWMGLDMEGSGRLRSEWNRTLLSDVCTAAYTQLLLRAAAQLGPSSTYYALFPASKPDHPWSLLVTRLYESLTEVPILHTRAVEPGVRKSDHWWVTPRQALYKDEEFARGAALTSALVSEGLPVVEPPLGARALLLEHSAGGGDAAVCTPALVRARLRGFGRHGGLERREDALTLLEYCLEDVLDDEAGDHLVNLPLVPLLDGLLGKFAKRPGASGLDFVLASNEVEERVLEGVPHRVVDGTVAGALGERIRSIAQSGTTNGRLLSAPLLGALLSEILPLEWRGQGHVAWEVLGANAQLSASEQEQEVRSFTQRDAALRAQSGRRVSASLVVPLTKQCSVNWLAALWQWLGEHSRADVKDFSDWPLLPVSDGGLCQLSLSSAVIGQGWEALESGTATTPPENVPSLDESTRNGASSNPQQPGLLGVLRKLGCKFLHPGVIPVSEHPLASQFVHPPTAVGILKALSAACEKDRGGLVSQRVANLNLSERSLLRRFFTQPRWWSGALGQPDSSSVNILRSLPIFETFGASADTLVALVSSRVFLPPKDVDEALLGDSFLKPESKSEARILAGPLGVPVLGKAAFYRGHVFGRILGLPADVRDKSMLAALRDLPGLCSEDPTFREIISRLPFVPAGGQDRGELLPPSALYDPRVEELLLLLEGGQSRSEKKPPPADLQVKADSTNTAPSHQTEADTKSQNSSLSSSGFFPTGSFATPQALDALRYLGLKTSVSQETVLAAARAVEWAAASDPEAALTRGRAILEYLEVHGHKWMPGAGEDVRKALSKFGNYLGIKEARASESGLEKFWSELSSTQWCPVMVAPPDPGLPWPTVTGTVSAPRFCRPAVDMWLVSASLRILDGECRSAALAHQMGWDKPPGPAVLAAQLLELGKRHLRVGGRAVGRQLAAAIPRIYTLLHQLLGREEMEIVKAVLEGCSWVWVGDGFAPVDQVAFTGPLNLAPYLFVVPSDLSAFQELLSELGVREALAPGDYARVLARMAADTDGCPLQDGQLSVAVWLVQQLADAHLPAEDARSAIHVPDAAGILAPAGELVYNDAPWLEGFGGSDGLAPSATASSSRFVHAKVGLTLVLTAVVEVCLEIVSAVCVVNWRLCFRRRKLLL
jgi:sacsin